MSRYVRIVEDAVGTPYRAGNSFDILQNGDEIFPAMLGAIRSAEHSVEFLSYVFWHSRIGTEFAEALAERARAGVQVRMLVDALGGASINMRTIWQLERAGVHIGWFRPGHWQNLRRLNNRTHRKLLIVDGRTGFTGGVGIADPWTGHAQDRRHWRDTHCRITGPACVDLHASFAESWAESTRERLQPLAPPPSAAGSIAVHTTSSTAGARPTGIEQLVGAVFEASRHRLWISSAYFVPNATIMRLLTAAATRGVDVRVLTNGATTNHRITMLAGRASFRRLLETGVKLYEYQPTLHHSKVMLADSAWATIGSTNLDARSLILNDELNVSVTDPGIISQLEAQFLADLAHSEEILPATWRQRGRLARLFESGSSLFSDQL
jgi:cardiolipin synthase